MGKSFLAPLSLAAVLVAAASGLAAAEDNGAASNGTGKTGAVAYPDSPSGTPQTQNAGAPVVTDKAACAAPGKCQNQPAPSPAADTATTGGNQAQSGGVATPATAYPKAPVATPATDASGKAPN